MNKINKHGSGFAVLEAILILIILGLIGTVGWVVYKNQVKNSSAVTDTSASPTKNATPITTKLDKTYTDEVGSFSVKYPSTWQIKTNIDSSDPQHRSSITTMTSPSGTVLNLNADWGGRGGACEPNATDVAFKAGNNCPTLEYLSSKAVPLTTVYEGISTTNPTTGNSTTTYKLADIRLVTLRYADTNGVSTYTVGLAQSSQYSQIVSNTPKMGVYAAFTSFAVYNQSGKFYPYIDAYASGPTAAFLTTSDVTTIKAILSSIKVNI